MHSNSKSQKPITYQIMEESYSLHQFYWYETAFKEGNTRYLTGMHYVTGVTA